MAGRKKTSKHTDHVLVDQILSPAFKPKLRDCNVLAGSPSLVHDAR